MVYTCDWWTCPEELKGNSLPELEEMMKELGWQQKTINGRVFEFCNKHTAGKEEQ